MADAETLVRAAAALLGDGARLAAMGEHARAFAALHRGATVRTVAALAPAIAPYVPEPH